MLTVISPAKNLRTGCTVHPPCSRPLFLAQTNQLAAALRTYSPWQLESLLQVNPELALKAYELNQAYDPAGAGETALTAYNGLLYQKLDAVTLSPAAFAFSQDHLRILSGFYGIVRPGDAIQPYRLEMQTKLPMQQPDGQATKTLYAFWGDRLYQELYRTGEPVVNLASNEYAKGIERYLQPADRWVTCRFLVHSRGRLKMLPTAAKMARGQMARFIVENSLDRPEDIQAFDADDFSFVPELSDRATYTFVQGTGW